MREGLPSNFKLIDPLTLIGARLVYSDFQFFINNVYFDPWGIGR